MVTSPKPPGSPNIPPRQSGDDHPEVQRSGKDKLPWPVLMLFVLAVLMIQIITILPRGRKTTKTPVQLSQLEIVPAPAVGGRSGVYLDALLHNTGTTDIAEFDVRATFVENNGTLKTVNGLLVEDVPGTRHSHDLLVHDPIKPNESRRVSIYVEEPPTEWNHQPPQITVENVSATTPP